MAEQLMTAGVEEPIDSILQVRFIDPEKQIKKLLKHVRNSAALTFLVGGDAATRGAIARRVVFEELLRGRSIFSIELNTYIDSHFGQKEDTVRMNARKAQFLWLSLDFYRAHSWASQLFIALACARARLSTLVTEEDRFESKLPQYLNPQTISVASVKLKLRKI